MMKNRATGYLYGGSMAKPKKKKMAMGGTAKKKVTPMGHGGGAKKKPGLYMMGKGGAMKKATKKDAMTYAMGGDKLKGVRAMANSLGMMLVPKNKK